jgi:acyl carrier protein
MKGVAKMNEVIQDKLEEQVIQAIADVLEISNTDINIEDTLLAKLSLESVELLELNFLLEERFDITFQEDELWNLGSYIVNNDLFSNGNIRKEAYNIIKKSIPEIKDEQIAAFTSPFQLNSELTIKSICDLIRIKTNVNMA